MNLRYQLTEAIDLIDKHPNIKTDKLSKSLSTALKGFREKFDLALKALDEQKPWDDLKSKLIRSSQIDAQEEIKSLKTKDFEGLCKFLKIDPSKATKKLSARLNAEAKLLKKISEIRKQTL